MITRHAVLPLCALLLASGGCLRHRRTTVSELPPAPVAGQPETAPVQPSMAPWTAADSSATARIIADELARRSWATAFRDRTGRMPALRIVDLDDRTNRSVDLRRFSRDLGAALTSQPAMWTPAPEGTPADMQLTGVASASEDGTSRHYQFDLRLVDAQGQLLGPPIAYELSKPLVAPEPPPSAPER